MSVEVCPEPMAGPLLLTLPRRDGVRLPLAAQLRRRYAVWAVRNRRASIVGLAAFAAGALPLFAVALLATSTADSPSASPTAAESTIAGRAFPSVERMVPAQREAMARLRVRAAALSAAATPELLRLLDAPALRAHLRECCSASGVASWPAPRLLDALREAAASAELVHNFEGFEWVTDATLEILETNATAYFPSLWPLRYLGYYGAMRQEWGHPQNCEDASEEGIFGLVPFGGEHDLPKTWAQASSRLHYVALNMLQVDGGNPQFGRVAAVFSPSFWSDAVAATPVDSGLYEGWCNATYMGLPNATHSIGLPVECELLDPSPGVGGSLDHVLLSNAHAWANLSTNSTTAGAGQLGRLFSRWHGDSRRWTDIAAVDTI
eukprot:3371359-Prymnesium_polylepis.1